MATQMFKDGTFVYVNGSQSIKSHLALGYTFEDKSAAPAAEIETLYPSNMRHLADVPIEKAKEAVLAEMGIEIVNPESTPPVEPQVVEQPVVEPQKTEKPKRGRKQKAKK